MTDYLSDYQSRDLDGELIPRELTPVANHLATLRTRLEMGLPDSRVAGQVTGELWDIIDDVARMEADLHRRQEHDREYMKWSLSPDRLTDALQLGQAIEETKEAARREGRQEILDTLPSVENGGLD